MTVHVRTLWLICIIMVKANFTCVKHHATDVKGSGGEGPDILNLGPRWRLFVAALFPGALSLRYINTLQI
jgi:hypothetical protein